MPEPMINITHLKQLLGNDDRMVVQFLEIFKEEVPLQLSQMRQAILSEDWKAIAILAHGIKSQVTYLQLTEYIELALTIEQSAERKVNVSDIPGLYSRLESGLSTVIDRL